ncbi:hypothetical protein VNO77_15130 [Canavalia gladiata]|uniref:Uncharacterized protein n=1 Tax=Canavalia gladiata TaxID=3824 RepID=A0AAN9LYR6_CANGL
MSREVCSEAVVRLIHSIDRTLVAVFQGLDVLKVRWLEREVPDGSWLTWLGGAQAAHVAWAREGFIDQWWYWLIKAPSLAGASGWVNEPPEYLTPRGRAKPTPPDWVLPFRRSNMRQFIKVELLSHIEWCMVPMWSNYDEPESAQPSSLNTRSGLTKEAMVKLQWAPSACF